MSVLNSILYYVIAGYLPVALLLLLMLVLPFIFQVLQLQRATGHVTDWRCCCFPTSFASPLFPTRNFQHRHMFVDCPVYHPAFERRGPHLREAVTTGRLCLSRYLVEARPFSNGVDYVCSRHLDTVNRPPPPLITAPPNHPGGV